MKRRKNYLHTKFIQFLIENENKSIEDEVKEDEVIEDEVKADEVIERLLNKLKNVSDEYDDIVYRRTRK